MNINWAYSQDLAGFPHLLIPFFGGDDTWASTFYTSSFALMPVPGYLYLSCDTALHWGIFMEESDERLNTRKHHLICTDHPCEATRTRIVYTITVRNCEMCGF